jgi:hypothetical protein
VRAPPGRAPPCPSGQTHGSAGTAPSPPGQCTVVLLGIKNSAGIFKQSIGARIGVGIELSTVPARQSPNFKTFKELTRQAV